MKTIIAVLLLTTAMSPAMAAKSYDSDMRTPKIYIGVSGGKDSTDIPAISTSSTAYSVFAGYAFNNYVAAELGYTSFGSLDLGTPDTMKSSAANLSVVGSLPLGKAVSLFGKVGYASTVTELTVGGITLPTESTGNATYGAGIQFNFGQRVAMRLGYDNYKIMVGTVNYNSNLASLGFMFKF